MFDVTDQLAEMMPTALTGRVVQTAGTAMAVADFPAPVGCQVEIQRQTGGAIYGEVIGFRNGQTLVSPLGELQGIRHGSQVRLRRTARQVRIGRALLGRVVNAHGEVIDGKSGPMLSEWARLDRSAPTPVERPRIDRPLTTGIRAIDGLLTCGKGQRVGIFSGSGVGKSVLMGMMARYTTADVNVIALIGERGREVNEFIERDLGPEGLQRSVVVVATSDEPPLVRLNAAFTATAIAESFRDQGRDAMLLLDSTTRLAMAQREIGLAAGEPPTTRGYPPSVFALLPKLIERTGQSALGSITAFYTVLVEGDDENEPIADTLRGLLDGHLWLSRKIAARGQYPAIDVLSSVSRLMTEVASVEHQQAAGRIRQLLAAYQDHEDLISIGAYRQGSNPTVDAAISLREALLLYLQQRIEESSNMDQAIEMLKKISDLSQQPAPNNQS